MRRILILFLMISLCLPVSVQVGMAQRKSTTAQKTTAKKKQQRRNTTTRRTASRKKSTPATRKRATSKPAVTVKGLQNERKNLQADKAANIRKKEQLKQDVKRGMENLMVLDGEIANQRKVVDTIRQDVSQLNSHILLLDSQLVTLSSELEERRQRFMKSMRYMHRNRSVQNQLMFIFSADNFNQMFRRLHFTRVYASYQKAQGEAVKVKQRQVEHKREELKDSRIKKTALLARGEQEQKTLEGKQTAQQEQVAQLKKQQQTVDALIQEQQRREAELNARIDKLIAEEVAREKARQEAEARKKAAAEAAKKRAAELARKKAAAEAARKENERRVAVAKAREEEARRLARQAAKEKASRERRAEAERKAREAEAERKRAELVAREENAAREREIAEEKKKEEDYRMPAEDRQMTGGFESNRGRLPLPITGAYRLLRGFGTYSPEGLSRVRLQSNGWHLKGQRGAKAQCVFDGVVSGVYYQGGSYIVTVRHGKYISAYINLASVNVKKGQRVRARAVLGSLGGDMTMQFQLRNWSTLLNPSRWIRR